MAASGRFCEGVHLVWVVDKKTVRHVLEHGGEFVDIPVRASFEYEVRDGDLVDGSLTIRKLYNARAVANAFDGIDMTNLDLEIEATVEKDVREHIAFTQKRNHSKESQ